MNKAEFLDKLCQGLRFQADPDEIRRVVARPSTTGWRTA